MKENAQAVVDRVDSAMHHARRRAGDFSSEALLLAGRHPVKMVAFSVAAGFLLGALIGRRRRA